MEMVTGVLLVILALASVSNKTATEVVHTTPNEITEVYFTEDNKSMMSLPLADTLPLETDVKEQTSNLAKCFYKGKTLICPKGTK